jgi:hypothetical protein
MALKIVGVGPQYAAAFVDSTRNALAGSKILLPSGIARTLAKSSEALNGFAT